MAKKKHKVTYEHSLLIDKLIWLEDACHRSGLHVTGHALNRAKNALGWEAAGDVLKAGAAARGEKVK